MIDPTVASRFQKYLLPNERLAWTGGPPVGIRFVARDAFLIPFSLLWGGFAIFWEAMVLGLSLTQPSADAPPTFMALFGLPFVAIGLYLIFGRFLLDAWVRKHTAYALTDRRALVLRTFPGEKLLTVKLETPNLEMRKDGRGTLRFGPTHPLSTMFAGGGWGFWLPAMGSGVEFMDVANAMSVYQLASRDPAAP